MTFDILDHEFRYLGHSDERPRGSEYAAVCACSNPDGEGHGAVEFNGVTTADVVMSWGEHLLAAAATPMGVSA